MKVTRRTPASQNRAVNIAVASASLLSLSAIPAVVRADGSDATPSTSGVYVTILSPNPGTDLTGKKNVDVTAYYESSYGVSSIELYIDGQKMATQHLTSAENRGEISFVVASDSLQPGNHAIVVRATATDEEVASAKTILNLPTVATTFASPAITNSNDSASDSSSQTDVAGAPSIQIESPSASDSVQGVVQIKVNAVDASGKPPYVSLFIDRSFKTLRNFAPYTFDWDTTKLPNGPHTIEVFGYNDAQQVGHASPVRVNVNNPSGHTFERTDLSDIAPLSSTPRPISVTKTNIAKPITHTAKIAKVVKHDGVEPKVAFDFLDSVVPHLVSSDRQIDRIDSAKGIDGSIVETANTNDGTVDPMLDQIAASNIAASHASKTMVTKAAAVVRRVSNKNVPHLRSEPAVVTDSGDLAYSSNSVKSASRLDNLMGEPIESTLASVPLSVDNGSAPNVMITRRVSAKSAPSLVAKPASHIQIASAKMDVDPEIAPSITSIVAPKVDLNQLERDMHEMPLRVGSIRVNVGELSIHEMDRLKGSYQVVVDDQRVSLNEPLQERGALLYAPMRQIFESQGGQLSWDQAKRQVHAVSDAGDVLLRIGSRHAIVNNVAVKMQGTAYLLNDHTMLPVDFYAKAMNANVSFDPVTGHLVIESNK